MTKLGWVVLVVISGLVVGCGPSHPLDGEPVTCQVEHVGEDALGFYTCDPSSADGADLVFSPRSADATWIAGCWLPGSVAHRDEEGRVVVIDPMGREAIPDRCWNGSRSYDGWDRSSCGYGLISRSVCGGTAWDGTETIDCGTEDGRVPTCLYLGRVQHVLEP